MCVCAGISLCDISAAEVGRSHLELTLYLPDRHDNKRGRLSFVAVQILL